MTSVRHDPKTRAIIKLDEATTKREFRLFTTPELEEELGRAFNHYRSPLATGNRRFLHRVIQRIEAVIDEREVDPRPPSA